MESKKELDDETAAVKLYNQHIISLNFDLENDNNQSFFNELGQRQQKKILIIGLHDMSNAISIFIV